MLGPSLIGAKISLEPVRLDDLALFTQWRADRTVTRYLNMRMVPSLSQETEWYERMARDESVVHWSIALEGRTIGSTEIRNISARDRQASTGMMIGERSEWGKGYASEAVALRSAFAFEDLALERLETCSLADNAAMHRVLEKVGYRLIGRRTRAHWAANGWHDELLFELLRDDWASVPR
jgi:RimJ/RimL family protein N-acetyltransferase